MDCKIRKKPRKKCKKREKSPEDKMCCKKTKCTERPCFCPLNVEPVWCKVDGVWTLFTNEDCARCDVKDVKKNCMIIGGGEAF